jgi:hypothetical protein
MQYLQNLQKRGIGGSHQSLMKMIEPGLVEVNIRSHELGGKDCDTLYEYCKYTVKAELVLSWCFETGDILVKFTLPEWMPKEGTRSFSIRNAKYTADMCVKGDGYCQSSTSVMRLNWDQVRGVVGSFHTSPKNE